MKVLVAATPRREHRSRGARARRGPFLPLRGATQAPVDTLRPTESLMLGRGSGPDFRACQGPAFAELG
jgi:hypothetical protein